MQGGGGGGDPKFAVNDISFPSPLIIELSRGGPRGGDNFTSLFHVLQTLYSKRQKHPVWPWELQPRRGHPVKHCFNFMITTRR